MLTHLTGNRLLDSLPPGDASEIAQYLHDEHLPLKEVIYRSGDAIELVYFPVGAVLSVLAVMENGDAVEVATIGLEGLSGSQLLFDARRMGRDMICQIEGDAKYMRRSDFLRFVDESSAFRQVVYAYTESLFNFMEQSIGCNRLHSLNERCARWLLSTSDRAGADEYFLTQEFLAIMLGTSRPAVTLAAGTLQQAGLIKYRRGALSILDREGLEEASCECYAATVSSINRTIDKARMQPRLA
ncbi:MAG: Crp/Fnr family transcriptional regulator [Candidatus Eremiobacteraeota bacterium]|nr:Crp/Fnr family transcriptional regulator [Candidatus Eremiobacteraeota bacterium]